MSAACAEVDNSILESSINLDSHHGFSGEKYQLIISLIQQSQINDIPRSSTIMAVFISIMSSFATYSISLGSTYFKIMPR